MLLSPTLPEILGIQEGTRTAGETGSSFRCVLRLNTCVWVSNLHRSVIWLVGSFNVNFTPMVFRNSLLSSSSASAAAVHAPLGQANHKVINLVPSVSTSTLNDNSTTVRVVQGYFLFKVCIKCIYESPEQSVWLYLTQPWLELTGLSCWTLSYPGEQRCVCVWGGGLRVTSCPYSILQPHFYQGPKCCM